MQLAVDLLFDSKPLIGSRAWFNHSAASVSRDPWRQIWPSRKAGFSRMYVDAAIKQRDSLTLLEDTAIIPPQHLAEDGLACPAGEIEPAEKVLTVTTAASAEFPFSDMLAERAGVMLPDDMDTVLGCMDRSSMKSLEKLASAESYLRAIATQPDNVAKDEKFH